MFSQQPGALLRQIAYEFHHHKQQNKEKAGPESQQRRSHTRDLNDLQKAFESLLTRWVADETQREAWRAHFYHYQPIPDGPELVLPPLFKGRDGGGQMAEILPVADTAYEIRVDGKPMRRTSRGTDLPARRLARLHIEGMSFAEAFDAPEEALASLADYYAHPADGAPWGFAEPLYSDGLIDANFGLTLRGRRWFDARQNGIEKGIELWL